MSGGREKKALLSDAVEALIAALYLDAGLDTARRFIEEHVIKPCDLPEDGLNSTVTDHKSALQEMAQTLKLPPPRYSIVAEAGPEHSKIFTVEVPGRQGLGEPGRRVSKKSASQKAAQQVLQQLAETDVRTRQPV
jgi:ribonuclease-3